MIFLKTFCPFVLFISLNSCGTISHGGEVENFVGEYETLNKEFQDTILTLYENGGFKISDPQLFQFNTGWGFQSDTGTWDTYLADEGWSLIFYNPNGKIVDYFRRESGYTEVYVALNSGQEKKVRIRRVSSKEK